MKIDTTPETLQPQFQAAVAREGTDFQTALDAAKKKSAETNGNSSAAKADAARKKAAASHRADATFLADYVTKTPAQHMRDRVQQLREEILKRMGLSEQALAAMPPGQREAVEKSIMAEIQKRLFGEAGKAEESQNPANQFDLQPLLQETKTPDKASNSVRS
ncbi:MAG: hypothetical protein WC073_05180 [Sterolibacterium sp.]